MNTKHTPGPWKYDGIVIKAHDSNVLFHAGRPNEEHHANAKLIAAAPELLDALKHVLNDYNTISIPSSIAIDKAQSAIKKATP